jgi:protein-tyrosine-phosphatase
VPLDQVTRCRLRQITAALAAEYDDVVVTMGCGEACPVLPGPRYLDWPIAGPAGQDLATVRRIRHDIADHVLDLLKELL